MTYIRGDLYGYTKVDPIYNAASGYCFPAGRLIPVQFAKMENSYESNVVATRTSIGAMENTLKENKKGVFSRWITLKMFQWSLLPANQRNTLSLTSLPAVQE